jgi:hypothetical protein
MSLAWRSTVKPLMEAMLVIVSWKGGFGGKWAFGLWQKDLCLRAADRTLVCSFAFS